MENNNVTAFENRELIEDPLMDLKKRRKMPDQKGC